MGNSDIYLDISFEHDSFDLLLFFSFCFCVYLFFFFFGGGRGGGGPQDSSSPECYWLLVAIISITWLI